MAYAHVVADAVLGGFVLFHSPMNVVLHFRRDFLFLVAESAVQRVKTNTNHCLSLICRLSGCRGWAAQGPFEIIQSKGRSPCFFLASDCLQPNLRALLVTHGFSSRPGFFIRACTDSIIAKLVAKTKYMRHTAGFVYKDTLFLAWPPPILNFARVPFFCDA